MSLLIRSRSQRYNIFFRIDKGKPKEIYKLNKKGQENKRQGKRKTK